MEFTDGRASVAVERLGVLDSCRGTEIVGLLERLGAGEVTIEPTMDARMSLSYTCVPGPARCEDTLART